MQINLGRWPSATAWRRFCAGSRRGRRGFRQSSVAVLVVTVMAGTLGVAVTPVSAGGPVGVVTNFTAPTINAPEAIAAGPDGNLWFTNTGGSSVGRITPAGVVTNFTAPTINAPTAIAAGPDGNLWFTNTDGSSVGRITPAGVVTNFTDPTINGPAGIAAGPDGNLWFTNYGGGSVGRIGTGGTNITAQDHTYSVVGGNVLDVSAPGVLADAIVSGPTGQLRARVTQIDFSHDEYTWNGDGSFEYRAIPRQNPIEKRITYVAYDEAGNVSNPATITIQISPGAPLIVATQTAYQIKGGQTLDVPASDLLDNAESPPGTQITKAFLWGIDFAANEISWHDDSSFSYFSVPRLQYVEKHVTFVVVDALGHVSSPATDLIAILPGGLFIVTRSVPDATIGKGYSATLTQAHGVAPVRWHAERQGMGPTERLPKGLRLNAKTGVISGTPTPKQPRTSYFVSIDLTDHSKPKQSASEVLTIFLH